MTSGRSRPMIVDTVRNAPSSTANPVGSRHACRRCPVSHSMEEAPNATPITVHVSVNDDPTAAAVSSTPTRCRATQSVHSSSSRPIVESNTKSSARAPTASMETTRTTKPDSAVVAARWVSTEADATTGPLPAAPAAHARDEHASSAGPSGRAGRSLTAWWSLFGMVVERDSGHPRRCPGAPAVDGPHRRRRPRGPWGPAHAAVRRRFSVHFERCDRLLERLRACRLDNSHDVEMRRLLRRPSARR